MQQILARVKTNWQAGLTVALVSVPLSISLAIASGASPIAGIITAVWAGLVAAIFGGSHFNVVGPAGALTGILSAYVLLNGAETLPLVAMVAGAIVLVAWFFRLERYLVFVPGSTIHGFTLGVAITIAFSQFAAALGLTNLTKHPEFAEKVLELWRHLGETNQTTFIVFLIFFILLFVLRRLVPKIPGAVILAPIGIIFGYLATVAQSFGPSLTSLATIGSTFPGIKATLFMMPKFGFNEHVFISGAAVAFVAILETMLSAKIADGMTKTVYNERKEMFGLGLANLASGLAGGLPATGVLVRTAINAKSGANHKTASGLNAIFVGLISLVLFGWFSYLPMSVIAAILIFASIRMVETEHFKRFFEHDKTGFVLSMVVAFITFYKDPIVGLAVGTAVALLIFMDKISRGQFEAIVNNQQGIVHQVSDARLKSFAAQDEADHVLVYAIKGQLAYINSQAHLARFRAGLNGYKAVVLRLRELSFVDLDGIDALAEIIDLIQEAGIKVALSGVSSSLVADLGHVKEFKTLKEKGLVFAKTSDALNSLKIQG